MSIKKVALIKAFQKATIDNHPYVFAVIEAEGIKECIVIPKESFEAKREFYLNAYNDDLVHVMNSNVKIIGVGYGDKKHLSNFI